MFPGIRISCTLLGMFLATLNDVIAGIQKKERKQKITKSFEPRSASEKKCDWYDNTNENVN